MELKDTHFAKDIKHSSLTIQCDVEDAVETARDLGEFWNWERKYAIGLKGSRTCDRFLYFPFFSFLIFIGVKILVIEKSIRLYYERNPFTIYPQKMLSM